MKLASYMGYLSETARSFPIKIPMNETWETEKMRGMRRKRKKCPYHEEKRSTIMMNIDRNRGLKGGINHNKKT